MTVLGIHYLTGHVVAADQTRSEAPEWPPHFGRVFMAMAAALFETRGGQDERAALEWIERAGAPAMCATVRSGDDDGFHWRRARGRRRYEAVKAFVPVNDQLESGSVGIVPRARQSRAFPTAWLENPCVYFQWDSEVSANLLAALDRLCGKVTRIGHSFSLVQMWVADPASAGNANWHPDSDSSELRMRVPEPGTLQYLEKAFNGKASEQYSELVDAVQSARGKEKKRLKAEIAERFPQGAPISHRPVLTHWQGYASVSGGPRHETVHGPFDPQMLVFSAKSEQRVLGLEATLQLTSALRDAALKAAGENIPEWISGHQPDGSPSRQIHAAFFPLPFVGAQYADGHIMGLAMAVPRQVEEEELRSALAPLLFSADGTQRTIHLWRNSGGRELWRWSLDLEARDDPPTTLRASTWTGAATEWASVTPVVLHHYPKQGRSSDVERIVLDAFVSAGLPVPSGLRISSVSAFAGAGHVRDMPAFTDGGEKLCRYQVHIRVQFATAIQGPLLLGRGRFRGYGLLRPLGVRHG